MSRNVRAAIHHVMSPRVASNHVALHRVTSSHFMVLFTRSPHHHLPLRFRIQARATVDEHPLLADLPKDVRDGVGLPVALRGDLARGPAPSRTAFGATAGSSTCWPPGPPPKWKQTVEIPTLKILKLCDSHVMSHRNVSCCL